MLLTLLPTDACRPGGRFTVPVPSRWATAASLSAQHSKRSNALLWQDLERAHMLAAVQGARRSCCAVDGSREQFPETD
jgi:hypothetical protein